MIRVMVADDHPAFRRGVALMVERVPGIEIAAEAETGVQAVTLAQTTPLDVVLMDLRMPGLDGIEATRRICRVEHPPAVVVLTMFEDDDSVVAALRAGARGYLLKGAEQEEIVGAVRAAASGQGIFGPEITSRVVAHFAAGGAASGAGTAFPTLTPREREVLGLVARGRANATIAHELMISLKTTRNHVSNIFTKLGVNDRAAAIVKAREGGFR